MEQRHVTLCWPNQVQEATLSGGSWSSTLPLNHMATPVFAEVSESTDTSLASTQFDVSLERFRPIGVVALANHNLSVDAKWRIRLWRDELKTDLSWDSGWVDVWPSVYATAELEWEYDNFWLGTVTEDDRESFTSLTVSFSDTVQIVRGATVEINDTTNAEGVVRVGRVFLGDTWQPTYNASYGIQYGYEINTQFETANDARQTEYADVKIPKRTVNFALENLSEEEGFRRLLALQREQGVSKEILYAEGVGSGTLSFSKTFIGRQTSVDPLTHPYFATYSGGISLKEIL